MVLALDRTAHLRGPSSPFRRRPQRRQYTPDTAHCPGSSKQTVLLPRPFASGQCLATRFVADRPPSLLHDRWNQSARPADPFLLAMQYASSGRVCEQRPREQVLARRGIGSRVACLSCVLPHSKLVVYRCRPSLLHPCCSESARVPFASTLMGVLTLSATPMQRLSLLRENDRRPEQCLAHSIAQTGDSEQHLVGIKYVRQTRGTLHNPLDEQKTAEAQEKKRWLCRSVGAYCWYIASHSPATRTACPVLRQELLSAQQTARNLSSEAVLPPAPVESAEALSGQRFPTLIATPRRVHPSMRTFQRPDTCGLMLWRAWNVCEQRITVGNVRMFGHAVLSYQRSHLSLVHSWQRCLLHVWEE